MTGHGDRIRARFIMGTWIRDVVHMAGDGVLVAGCKHRKQTDNMTLQTLFALI